MTSIPNINKEILFEFAEATKRKDFFALQTLLSDSGVFEVQDNEFETIEADKTQFINWYKSKLQNITITSIFYDKCLHCYIDNPAILLNDGQFPRMIKDDSERSKTGLMLEIKDDKITYIKFCFVFRKTINKYKFECVAELIKKYLDEGYTFDEAYKKAKGQ